MGAVGFLQPLSGGTIKYVSNSKVRMSLDRSWIYRDAIKLTLKSQPTVTIANNTAAKTNVGDDWAVVKKVTLFNGSTPIREFTGAELRWFNALMLQREVIVPATLGDGATANPELLSTLYLPITPGNLLDKPYEFSLNAPLLSNVPEIEIEWGTFTSISDDASAWTIEPSIFIEVAIANGPVGEYPLLTMDRFGPYPVSDLVSGIDMQKDKSCAGILLHFQTSAFADSNLVNFAYHNSNMTVTLSNQIRYQASLATLLNDIENRNNLIQLNPVNTSEGYTGYRYLNFLTEEPGMISERIQTVVKSGNGVKPIDKFILKADSLAMFANSTDYVTMLMLRYPNPIN